MPVSSYLIYLYRTLLHLLHLLQWTRKALSHKGFRTFRSATKGATNATNATNSVALAQGKTHSREMFDALCCTRSEFVAPFVALKSPGSLRGYTHLTFPAIDKYTDSVYNIYRSKERSDAKWKHEKSAASKRERRGLKRSKVSRPVSFQPSSQTWSPK